MHTNMLSDDNKAVRGKRMRFWMYWISAAISTLLFLLFAATMFMVPGIVPSTKMWMLCVVGVAGAISLGVGAWRFSSTEAPITVWPLGPMVAVVLLLELAECVIGVIRLATRTHP